MAERRAEEPDERLLFSELGPEAQDAAPWPGARAAPGGAVRLRDGGGGGEEEDDTGPEGDGEEEPLLGATPAGRSRGVGAAWDRDARCAAGTAPASASARVAARSRSSCLKLLHKGPLCRRRRGLLLGASPRSEPGHVPALCADLRGGPRAGLPYLFSAPQGAWLVLASFTRGPSKVHQLKKPFS